MIDLTKPYSIREIGLKIFLDETAAAHNNHAYADFISYLEEYEMKRNTIAARFGVHPGTMRKWIKIYKEEQEK